MPAMLYSSPYCSIRSQKWGIWPAKKRNSRNIIDLSHKPPPAATHPINGGNAPVKAPGTTAKAVADRLAVTKTLLGIDVVNRGKTVLSDVNEEQLLRLIEGTKVKIIVSPIGRQGFIFGRGNQQISPKVIRKVGVENVWIIATRNKLSSIQGGKAFRVDTGDMDLNEMLSGYRRVITGYKEEIVTKVVV